MITTLIISSYFFFSIRMLIRLSKDNKERIQEFKDQQKTRRFIVSYFAGAYSTVLFFGPIFFLAGFFHALSQTIKEVLK